MVSPMPAAAANAGVSPRVNTAGDGENALRTARPDDAPRPRRPSSTACGPCGGPERNIARKATNLTAHRSPPRARPPGGFSSGGLHSSIRSQEHMIPLIARRGITGRERSGLPLSQCSRRPIPAPSPARPTHHAAHGAAGRKASRVFADRKGFLVMDEATPPPASGGVGSGFLQSASRLARRHAANE